MLIRHLFHIADTGSLSAAVLIGGDLPCQLQMPADWDAAVLTFQTSQDGATYQNAYDANGNEVTVQAAASRNIQLNPSDFAGVNYLKIRSGTGATPVAQSPARDFTLFVMPL